MKPKLVMNIKHYFPVFLLILVCSCRLSEVDDKLTAEELSFFDLKSFFQGEIHRLSDLPPKVKKRITVNGAVEEKMIDKLDFNKELQLFLNSDINRPAWLDKYSIDSTFSEKGLSGISYLARDKKLKTRRLSISFLNQQVDSIVVENVTQTVIADTRQFLVYRPAKGYFIKSTQALTLSEVQNIEVDVLFLQ